MGTPMSALLNVEPVEAALLGGIMLWPDRGAELWRELTSEGLTPDDFGSPGHQSVAVACCELVERGAPLSTIAVHDALTAEGREYIGGLLGISKLEGHATAAHVRHHASVVRRAAARRRIRIWHLQQAEAIAEDDELCDPEPWQAHLEQAKADMANFAALGQPRGGTVTSADVIKDLHRDMANAAAGIKLGVSTGFPMLDLRYRPRRGHLVVEVGRPKMGKTTWQLAMTRNALFERSGSHGWMNRPDAIPVLWACDEMKNSELISRLLADVADVSGSAIADPPGKHWMSANMASLTRGSKLLADAPLEFVEEANCGRLERIFAAARTWRAKQLPDPKTGQRGPAFLCIDYLQRMTMAGVDKNANNEQRVTAMCKGAKTLARELDITVFLLAQLNRDCERREDKRPRASDIRDSGSVEQEADCILGIYRPIVYEPRADELRKRASDLRHAGGRNERQELMAIEDQLGAAEIIICANRHGDQGTVHVQFEGSRYRFSNPDRPDA